MKYLDSRHLKTLLKFENIELWNFSLTNMTLVIVRIKLVVKACAGIKTSDKTWKPKQTNKKTYDFV